jgi:hypothetical protein
MQGDGEHKDDRHDNSYNVQRHKRMRADVPAGEDGRVGQLDEENIDDGHGAQQQRLDGNGQAEEDGDSEVGEHAGEEDVVGQEAEAVVSAALVASPALAYYSRCCTGHLALTRELREKRELKKHYRNV